MATSVDGVAVGIFEEKHRGVGVVQWDSRRKAVFEQETVT